MDLTLSLSRGFHNAPLLYHDETVTPAPTVTNLWTGLQAAGEELGYGVKEGFLSVFLQPCHGWSKDGLKGALKGEGKGIPGALLKPPADF
ncbi:uncharacterized protein CDV56_101485 [Aspergillus thermomutatus]|uniref:Uncharacterized protein n=1 Tax=Aspergillus thermomutatus TaxID=41047 RepID=A0A397HFQ4_ASPTH|nr:uncharacterized protein CDV56_101485 [Aspergillus thermomutatus]RHZ61981.1 hypothetical protein CDV56_101485 [Aspergillus thermomutatus]